MAKSNPLLEQYAEREIARRIAKGELFTLEMVNAAILEDHEVWTKMMTIAVNEGAKIGKKVFREKIQPCLDGLLDDFARREKEDNGDQTHAISVVERRYNQIMEE